MPGGPEEVGAPGVGRWPASEWFGELDSTNSELARRLGSAAAEVLPGTTVVAGRQHAGRGRQGRTWSGSAADSLLFSVALPLQRVSPERMGWAPLLVGVACVEGLRAAMAAVPGAGPGAASRSQSGRIKLKWPNDVVVDPARGVDAGEPGLAKIAGILLEATNGWAIAGIGLNVGHGEAAIAGIPTRGMPASSLALEFGPDAPGLTRAAALEAIRARLWHWWSRWLDEAGDPVASGLREAYLDSCSTAGALVEVHLPGGDVRVGRATGLTAEGFLIVEPEDRPGEPPRPLAVSAGDVMHVRHR